MNIFKNLQKREHNKTVKRSYGIDSDLYNLLQDISENEYDISINKLVNLCIGNLISSGKVQLYEINIKNNTFNRSYEITENNIKGLELLKKKYNVSIQKLMNIAIRTTLIEGGYKV